MKKNLLIVAELVLTVVVLAVLTNLVADFVTLPPWIVLVIGLMAFAALIAVTFALLRQPPESAPSSSIPYQASRPLPEFTGRKDELRRLTRTLKPGTKTAITGLVGMGGLGKTELAKQAAQEVHKRFQDGVLWADCGEQDLTAVVDLWTAAYGVQLPGDDPQTKAAAWRGWVADRRVLLIFDNVQPGQNLEPLLPASDTPAVLITTRDTQHLALLGAELLRLDQFTLDEALALAAEILGRAKMQNQEAEAERLFGLVGYLPLAVNVSLQLARDCSYSLGHLNTKLEAAGALEVLGDRERLEKSLNATFQTARDNLGDLQEPFRTLALFNQGPSFSTDALAATLDLDPDDAGALLHRLAGRSLLTEEAEGRWSLHPLLREFVATLEPPDYTTHLRLSRHYERVARAADDLYKQGGDRVLHALALFDLEWPHIRAGQAWAAAHAEADDEAAHLCSAYPGAAAHLLDLRLHPRDRIAWLAAAARAARRLGHKIAEGWHLGNLGLAHADLGKTHQAIDHYQQALEIQQEIGNRHGEGYQLGNLGSAYRHLGKTHQAIEQYTAALEIAREIGDRRGEENRLGNLGNAYADLGETHQAIDQYATALEIAREIGDRSGEALTSWNLGLLYEDDDPARAVELMEVCVAYEQELGHPDAEADAQRVEEIRSRL